METGDTADLHTVCVCGWRGVASVDSMQGCSSVCSAESLGMEESGPLMLFLSITVLYSVMYLYVLCGPQKE